MRNLILFLLIFSSPAHAQLINPAGIPYLEVSSVTDTTTTSTSDAPMVGASHTNVPAGIYFAAFKTTLRSSANNATVTVTIYNNGNAEADTEQTAIPTVAGGLTPSLPSALPTSTSGIITVVQGTTVEIRWRTTAGTATARDRNFTLLRLF